MPRWCALQRSYGVGGVKPARRRGGAGSAARRTSRPAHLIAVYRTGLRCIGRLHGSRQLCDQHSRRRRVRLSSALGRRASPISWRCSFKDSPQNSVSRPGRILAELSREHAPKPVAFAMWIVSEFGAMATDLAEFLGAIVALQLTLSRSDACGRHSDGRHYVRDSFAASLRFPHDGKRSSVRSSA